MNNPISLASADVFLRKGQFAYSCRSGKPGAHGIERCGYRMI
jgi:hypothetical protein